MKILGPTRFHRLNEAGGLVYLFTGFFLILCLISYHPQDPSWNSVTGAAHAHNLTGLAGSYTADLCFQLLGLSAFSLPVMLWLLAWKWIRSAAIQAAGGKGVRRRGAVLSASPPRFPSGLSGGHGTERSPPGGVVGISDRRFAGVVA